MRLRITAGLAGALPQITGTLVVAAMVAAARAADQPVAEKPSTEEVVMRMIESNQTRTLALRQYRSQRRYIAENQHFSRRAEVLVQELYRHPARRELKVVSASGSPFVQHKVIDQLIEVEIESARNENRDQTVITPLNYKFRLLGTEEIDGGACYVLEVIPKAAKKYLMRGRIWVDQSEFAIVRMEGSPAKNPSFWTRKVHFVRRYQKHGPFWLPSSVESESELLIVGKSTLKIEYSEYQISAASLSPAGEGASSPGQEPNDGRKEP